MTDRSTGPRCGNNPNFQMSDGDRRAVDDFKGRLALQADAKPYIERAAWVDFDPLMEVIAATIWEHCARDDEEMPQLVRDDPRTIAAFAAAVARAHAARVAPATDQAGPSRRAGLRDEIVNALGQIKTVPPVAHRREQADHVLAVLYREWPWLRAEAEETATDQAEALASCPGYETSPNLCRCPCYGCKHHCSAHDPEDLRDAEGATDQAAPELTAEEARDLADELGTQLYRAQDALAFVEECCVIADREGRQPTTSDVREWLKGARCGRQLAADARDHAALRDRIAEAVRDAACNGDCGKTEEECAKERIQPLVWHHGRLAAVEGTPEQFAAAVLAVLPTPADRANVLRVAADAVALDRDATAGSRAGARQGMTRAVNLLRRMAAEAAPATGHDDSETGDCCGALPPDLFIDEAGREWHAGDCWCTLAPGHSDQHRCQPCTDRVGAPGWTDGPPAAAQQPKEA